MVNTVDHLEHLARDSGRFRELLRDADPGARVPTCPDWTAADLVWHLAEVQLFWGTVVRDRLTEPDAAEAARPDRPDDYRDLLRLAERAAADLQRALVGTPPETPVWTWWDQDRSAGFVRRRMSHEALIHRLDAGATVGRVGPVDADLADDGVDEALMAFFSYAPTWATVSTSEMTGRVRTTDTGHAWDITPGRWSGTSPSTGRSWDEPLLHVDPLAGAAEPAFTIEATARDLDAWLWGRPPVGPVTQHGDPVALSLVTEVLEQGIQ
ncbi:maleylpyruvate isomerase family mycothiol-dependent enzyme [Nakamurella endophytica]|uniref:Mycothiol-dependent maleylpyruvate isomerase metal-binding domain-containing protein n=1 Tax=Nakamurella endophytica TaxID=1748367 RepID=A0A917SKU8_9ACTN|nr:maleylpyruvate isomerase family mycothiol-dependent enzyme [Nakamurella endophytica]GGL85384.1 hypothetical protein GCM10011594_01330 [Nakamurella endophytica]